MSEEKKLFTDRRWTDIPMPEVIGHSEVSKEERIEARQHLEWLLKKRGILEEDDHFDYDDLYDLDD